MLNDENLSEMLNGLSNITDKFEMALFASEFHKDFEEMFEKFSKGLITNDDFFLYRLREGKKIMIENGFKVMNYGISITGAD